ncbi:MAG: biotin transporter BioY [Acidobacteriaceae bacterium]
MSSTSLPRLPLLSQADPLRRSLAGKALLCAAASLFIATCAHFSLPMPFTPVPTTLQTFAVLLVGLTLGPVGGFAALTLYLLEGASGLPVFSPQGPGGIVQLLGPTAGYLFAYPVAAALAGGSVNLLRRLLSPFPAALLSGVIALVPVFALGAMWLAHVLHSSGTQALHLAVTPFLVAEAFKITAAAAAYSGLRLAAGR